VVKVTTFEQINRKGMKA